MSARGKAAAVVTSAGILAAAWSAATLGGQTTAAGVPAVATDPTSLTSTDPSAVAVAIDDSQTPGADPSASTSAAGQTSSAASSAAASVAATKAGTTAKATTAAPAKRVQERDLCGPDCDPPVRIGDGLHHGLWRQDHQRVRDHHQHLLNVDIDHQLSRTDAQVAGRRGSVGEHLDRERRHVHEQGFHHECPGSGRVGESVIASAFSSSAQHSAL